MERVQSFCLICLLATPVGAETVARVDDAGFAPFNGLDSDGNGYVSRIEARIAMGLHQVFDSADANEDGLLDRSEYSWARRGAEVR